MALCQKCKAEVDPAAGKHSHRETRHAFYRALAKAGAEQCPTCRDYVMLAGHSCAAYQQFRDRASGFMVGVPRESAA